MCKSNAYYEECRILNINCLLTSVRRIRRHFYFWVKNPWMSFKDLKLANISSKVLTLATWYLVNRRLCFWANQLALNHASYITPVNQITACKIKKVISIFAWNMHQTESRRSVGVPSEV